MPQLPEMRGIIAQSFGGVARRIESTTIAPEKPLIVQKIIFEQSGPTYKMQAGTGINNTSDKEAAAIQAANQYRAAVEDLGKHPETDRQAARATLLANRHRANTAQALADAASQPRDTQSK